MDSNIPYIEILPENIEILPENYEGQPDKSTSSQGTSGVKTIIDVFQRCL